MGQKVHPYILRISFGKNWQSQWFTDRKGEFAQFLEEDLRVREMISKFYPLGTIARVIIERASPTFVRIKIKTSKPGVVIGRRGQDIERLKSQIIDFLRKEVVIDVEEVAQDYLEAELVAQLIAFQITKRVNFRRAMKRAIQQAVSMGAEGIKIRCSGRLGGVEIARSEVYKYGKIPLQTFRADIDYGFCVAKTTYGTIGVKVWIYKGEKLPGAYLTPEEEKEEKGEQ